MISYKVRAMEVELIAAEMMNPAIVDVYKINMGCDTGRIDIVSYQLYRNGEPMRFHMDTTGHAFVTEEKSENGEELVRITIYADFCQGIWPNPETSSFLNIQMICTLIYDDECMAFTADRGGIYCKVTVTAEYISITWPRSQVDIF